jgi:acetyltransferase-like isoleucine patch superfamily enzyme
MSLVDNIKSNPKLKDFVLWLLIAPQQARPRLWVKWFINPFKHRYGRGSLIRWKARLDVLPFNDFIVGEKTVVEDYAVINNGMGGIYIGSHSFIGIASVLIGPLRLGNDVIIAQNVVFSGLNHGYQDVDTPITKQPCTSADIIVEDDVWIGANSVITAGIHVGKHAVIAGGSVVTKNVPAYSVVGGNPARVLKQYSAESKQWERVR